jgi:hypothetical protein
MKTLSDGNVVTSRSYYYLLDFNEYDNWEYMRNTFNTCKLHELTLDQYKLMFIHATNKDITHM